MTKDLNADIECVAAASGIVDDAVGVDKTKWFVAIVNNNSERASEEKLNKLGYETFVAKQRVLRIAKNGKKSHVDKILLRSVVFVKCTEAERRVIVNFTFINRFMTNRAGTSRNSVSKPIAVISQREIDTLRFMLGQSDVPVTIADAPYRVNDRVTVIRGSLRGLEGEVIQTADGRSEVVVRIDMFGSARVTIDTTDIELVKK